MKRYYVQPVGWDRSPRMGVYARADRGGDRLIARGMSLTTAERICRLLNEDDRRTVDPRAMASGLTTHRDPAYRGNGLSGSSTEEVDRG